MKNEAQILTIVILLMMVCFVSDSVGDEFDTKIRQQEQKLNQIAEQIRQKRQERKQLQKDEAGALAQLKVSEEELALVQQYLQRLNQKEKKLKDQIDETTFELAEAESILVIKQKILEKRLVEIYKYGQYNFLEVLLTSDSFTDMLERFVYMQRIAEQDRHLYNEIQYRKEIIAQKKIELENQLTELNDIQAEKKAEETELNRERNRRKSILLAIRTKKDEYEKAIAELKNSQQKTQQIIDNLLAERERTRQKKESNDLSLGPDSKLPKRTGNHYFDTHRGKINWPILGKLITRFGREKHPRFGTETFNQGIRIKAEHGAPIRVIDHGEVIYTSQLRGYGNFIIIDHGEGYYTLYAHCSSIGVNVGNRVNRGQEIAKVGHTGSLFGDCLYFEIRSNGKPIDPLLYLQRH